MAISTLTLTKAKQLMRSEFLIDKINVYHLGGVVTEGYHTFREATLHAAGVPALVQSVTLENAVESVTSTTYSIKVSTDTDLKAGDLIKVTHATNDHTLHGLELLVDKVNTNGLALLRKAVASNFATVDQQGKEEIRWR